MDTKQILTELRNGSSDRAVGASHPELSCLESENWPVRLAGVGCLNRSADAQKEYFLERLMTNQSIQHDTHRGNDSGNRSSQGNNVYKEAPCAPELARSSQFDRKNSRSSRDRSQSQDHIDEGKVLDHVMPRFFHSVKENMAWTWLFKEHFQDEPSMVRLYQDNQLNSIVCGLMKMIIDYNNYFKGRLQVTSLSRVQVQELQPPHALGLFEVLHPRVAQEPAPLQAQHRRVGGL